MSSTTKKVIDLTGSACATIYHSAEEYYGPYPQVRATQPTLSIQELFDQIVRKHLEKTQHPSC